MNKCFFLLFFAFPFFLNAQDCTCEDSFNWVKKTFEENDAGFAYGLEQKGEDAYRQHNEQILKKVQSLEQGIECTQTLYEWLTFFRSGHLGISRTGGFQNQETPNEKEVRKQFADWPKVEVDEQALKEKLKGQKEAGLEGIWMSPPYKIAVQREGDAYVGAILEADGVYWTKGQVKFKVQADGRNAVYYMKDHSPREFEKVVLIGNNYLQMGFINLERAYPEFETPPTVERYLRLMGAAKPFMESHSDNTLILRIPDFSYSEKQLIDSVLEANKERILTTENLIIDLRNNGGGSDDSFYGILPYIYTNPIRVVGLEFLSTPLNNSRMRSFMEDPDFPEEFREWAEGAVKKLDENLGEFVNFDSTLVDITTLDTVYPYPKHVGIVINENNASTTEQFLLAAKQSKKVKLFGTTTYGMLDISNMYFIEAPCGDFQLSYSLSRSFRIPDMTIDEKGIQPDYYIDKGVEPYEWIDFVGKVMEGW
jgi:hypothetical protein